MKYISIFMVMMSFIANVALAENIKLDCKRPQLTQASMTQCAGEAFSATDKELNKIYNTLMAKYNASNGALLKKAEIAWLAYRNAECQYETSPSEGGSIYSMVVTQCWQEKTKARIKELTAQLECEEGDLACNRP